MSEKGITKTSDAFEEAYTRLNPEQKKAVDTIEGPVMVIAGPGTGKTQILTLRIANILLQTDTAPNSILALTFTESGVQAMRLKLRKIIGARADEVRIHTFHGFASSVITEFDEHFPHLAQSAQITDIEAEDMIRDILKEAPFSDLRPAGDPEFYVTKILGTISDAKREAWTADMIEVFAKEEIERIKNDEGSLSTRGPTKGKLKAEALSRIKKCERTIIFAQVYAHHEQRKRSDKKIDFDDLIIEVLVALKSDELLLRLLQEKFLYILVDEHQDTNDAQNLLVRMIADFFENPNIFVVGDEKQAIYRFQGASVANFLLYQHVWKNMEVIYLKSNYRSHQRILDAAFSLIEHNYDDEQYEYLRVKLHAAGSETHRPIDIITAGNTEAAEKYSADEIHKILQTEPTKTVAVIVRTNKDAERALAALGRYGIVASSQRGADVFSHPVGILFFALIRYLLDPSQIESLATTIAFGLWNLSFEDSTKLIRDVRSGLLSDIPKLIPQLKELAENKLRMGAIQFLMYLADISGFTRRIIDDPLSVEVWRSIVGLAEDIVHRSHTTNPDEIMKHLLAYATSAHKRSIKIAVGKSDACVQVMTIHSSKGLEFDYVFMPYVVEESWSMKVQSAYFILPREKEVGDEIKDSRRLFYVALTRARMHVSLCVSQQESDGKPLTALRFVDELSREDTIRFEIPALHEQAMSSIAHNERSQRETELTEYTERVLFERGLSVTALNHFLKCPSQFLYKSILRLPEPPHASSEKGNAMHLALSNVWKQSDRSQKNILTTIRESIETYFSQTSTLSLFEKHVVAKNLLDDVETVATCLTEHFALSGEILTEEWMEKKLETITIHGKLDSVIVKDDRVLVFDYKTREVMSEKEIRGETKNATGDYFRQLVFYKILLEAQPRFKGKEIIPALVFVKPNSKQQCPIIQLSITKEDEQQVFSEIHNLVDQVKSGEIVRNRCNEPDCDYCKLRTFRR